MSKTILNDREIDQYGRVSLSEDGLVHLLKSGKDISGQLISESDWLDKYQKSCQEQDEEPNQFQILETLSESIEEFDENRLRSWNIPEEYLSIDVFDYLTSKCKSEKEIERVSEEWILYERCNLVDVLRLMIFLIDSFRKKKVVWGVGRGSSVSSYILFLIGVHKIDSIKYDLDVKEFLRIN